ncbi:MAG TPA: KUP/HAK/KT family potassium transporter [Puia sp.]|jgi:KUP system potassium uptake protein|nr:KUP/HAK/KT family potassium transporter [Puia sp.]
MSSQHFKKISAAGLLITLGIIYGDIGTSPLYTFQTILNEGGKISQELVFGAISCVFWTLTLQTTFKYVFITLQADNKGEGGVFSLYALVRRYGKYLMYPAMIGAGTLLADGIITPPISVTSAIEGLNMVKGMENVIIPGNNLVIEIVLVIILLLFVFQRFGTKIVGGSFGPIMLMWFSMLAILGLNQILQYPGVLKALSPHYGLELLIKHPKGFWLLGAVFLCTTGAEALYSDLGHCGKKNIQITWIFVKVALVLNYLGQGAWVLLQNKSSLGESNPFFAIVPHWFLIPSVLIATAASIIASQALISGSFTLISEAISLNFWPKVTVKYPTNIRGQIYIPSINWVLCIGCFLVVLYFRTSANMTAAYGFSITIAMLMTTILMYYFLRYVKHFPLILVILILVVFATVESSFFIANAVKIVKRLFFLVFEFGLIFTMYIWYNARKINNRFLNFVNLSEYIPLLEILSKDTSVPKFSSHLIYLTKANKHTQIEQKIIYSIFSHNPKRADVYWFVHIERTDEPYTMEYGVDELKDDKVIRIELRVGFRVQPRVGMMFRKVVDEMINNKELDLTSRFPSLKKHNVTDDFRFVVLEKFLSYDNEFSVRDGFILNSYFAIKHFALSEDKAFGLDSSETLVEKLPLVVMPVSNIHLHRAYYRIHDDCKKV